MLALLSYTIVPFFCSSFGSFGLVIAKFAVFLRVLPMGADPEKHLECMIVTFQDIRTAYAIPAPPNGTHYLYDEGFFLFHAVSGWFDIQLFIDDEYPHVGELSVHVDSLHGEDGDVFLGHCPNIGPGLWRIENEYLNPLFNNYAFGFCVVAARYVEDEPNVLKNLVDGLKLPVQKTFAELMGAAGSLPAVRLANKRDGTNVHVIVNPSI